MSNADDNRTTELRELLDERGVEWKPIDGEHICFTEWYTHSGAFVYTARESFRSYGDHMLRVETCGLPKACLIATPEQAIAATLGSETCEMETDWDCLYNDIPGAPEDTWAYKCSACEWSFRYDRGIVPNFCPNCGKVVER